MPFRFPPAAAAAAAMFCLLPALGVSAGAAHTVAPAFVPASSFPSAFHELSAVTVFWALDEEMLGELWRTDGTTAGTLPLGACAGTCGPSGFTAGGSSGLAFYWLSDVDHTFDLWRTDGTAAGTYKLTELGDATWGSNEHEAQFVWHPELERLMFWVNDAWAARSTLWVSDGTTAGTRAVFAVPEGAWPAGRLSRAGDRFLFLLARETSPGSLDSEVWSSDGTTAGTVRIEEIPGFYPLEMQQTGFGVLFSGLPQDAPPWPAPCTVRLWSSGGTAATTLPVGDYETASPQCTGVGLALQSGSGDVAYFIAGLGQQELWRTDGTPGGTSALVDFALRPERLISGVLAEWRDGVYLSAHTPQKGIELYRFDAGGLSLVADACPGDCSLNPLTMLATAEYLFYVGGDFFDARPWMSDGSAAGTRPRPGCEECQNQHQTEVLRRGNLFFVAWDAEHGLELWATRISDGFSRRLTDLSPSQALAPPGGAGRGDLLLFAADDGLHGVELWRSDGTAAGTRLLRDLTGADEVPTGPPARPAAPVLTPLGPDAIDLTWTDVAGASRYRFEVRRPDGTSEDVFEGFGSNVLTYTHLQPGTPLSVRVRAENPFGVSEWSEESSATTWSAEPLEPCAAGADTLCLWGDRFRVEVDWHDQHNDKHGVGRTVEELASDRSGHFWFFKPDNLELIVKVLDGTSLNGFWWTFYGALTDVEYWITVTDTQSAGQRTYHSQPGTVCGRGDTASMPAVAGAAASRGAMVLPWTAPAAPAAPLAVVPRATAAAGAGESCVADAETLCLLDGRFRVRVAWQDQHNDRTGTGDAVAFTDRTGFFTFFNPSNVELVVKALDGRPVNGKFWFFYGALSDVGYTIEVEDLVDGQAVRRYVNPPGQICGQGDTAAF